MPFKLSSCCRAQASSLETLKDQPSASQKENNNSLCCEGYNVTNIKAADIAPPASGLHPKLRMNPKDYLLYKELMKSLDLPTKKAVFSDEILFSQRHDLPNDNAGKNSSSPRAGALFDDDSDYVSFAEHESFRLERLHRQKILSCSGENALSSEQKEVNDDGINEGMVTGTCNNGKIDPVSTLCDSPQEKTAAAIYDTPRGTPIRAIYDIPQKKTFLAIYDIPKKVPVATIYNLPKKHLPLLD